MVHQAFIRLEDVTRVQTLLPACNMARAAREFLIVARGTVPLHAFQQCDEAGNPIAEPGVLPAPILAR